MTHTRFLPPAALIPDIAPTAYDDQGDATTNPDFNKMLRGTVHDPSTRRMGGVAGHAGVFSTAGDVALFAQALLDRLAGRPSDFPLQQATLKLMTQPEQPSTAAGGATIFTAGWQAHNGRCCPWVWVGHQLGVFASARRALSHRQFWAHRIYRDFAVDGSSERYLCRDSCEFGSSAWSCAHLASARADRDGRCSSSSSLREDRRRRRRSPASTCSKPLTLPRCTKPRSVTAAICGWGLLTNQTGLDREGHRTIDVLLHSLPEVELKTLFSPEHGLLGVKDTTKIGQDTDPATHLPVVSPLWREGRAAPAATWSR